jgi:hypothetical protein|tara:strand:+ start:370 stop:579 length:210 start_codon:yes stop_codon:yes gene_type:complete
MTYYVTVERDKEPCPLQKVIMFTARCESHKIYSGGFTRDQAVKTVYRRITEEVGDPDPKLFVERIKTYY